MAYTNLVYYADGPQKTGSNLLPIPVAFAADVSYVLVGLQIPEQGVNLWPREPRQDLLELLDSSAASVKLKVLHNKGFVGLSVQSPRTGISASLASERVETFRQDVSGPPPPSNQLDHLLLDQAAYALVGRANLALAYVI